MIEAIISGNQRHPLFYHHRPPPQPMPIQRKPLKVRNVLYAEDDEAVSAECSRILNRAGYRVTAVSDGQSAWQALTMQKFDLFVTDNDMPQITGVQLVAKLRLSKLNLPIILASGSADFFSGREYRWLNLSACLQKPFTPGELLQTVARVLNSPPLPAPSPVVTATLQ